MQATLKQIRERKGVLKGAVAKAIGVSYPTYKKYEENPKVMSIQQLNAACKFLGCRRNDIFLD